MADQADLARDLLRIANDDLSAVEALVDVGTVSDAIVGFHAQQAAEKALKAALAFRGQEFPFTHNLSVLLQLCEDAGLDVPAAAAGVDVLTPYGVAGRYGRPSPGAVPRSAALALATAAVAFARSVIAG